MHCADAASRGAQSPDHTAGPSFEMYSRMGNFVPWHDAAWVLLPGQAAMLCRQRTEAVTHEGVPTAVTAAAPAAVISE